MPPRICEDLSDFDDDLFGRAEYYTCGIQLRVPTFSSITKKQIDSQGNTDTKHHAVPSGRYSGDSGVSVASRNTSASLQLTPTPSTLSEHTNSSEPKVWGPNDNVTQTVRFGRYKLESSLQSGVTATVYSAFDYYSGERVALKLIDASEPAADFRHAEHECQVLQHVHSHPNIAKLKGMSVQKGGKIAMAIEFVGPDLFDTLSARDWRIGTDEFLHYATQAASAVAHMHSLGFAHRDLKPENFTLSDDETVKLVDMGVARHIDEPGHVRRQAGTPGFMAPEQLVDTPDKAQLDLFPTDVWALGITFFNLLTGGLPFGDAADFDGEFRLYARGLHMRSKRKAHAWRSLSPQLRILLHGMLAIDVEERWTMPEVVSYLDQLRADPTSQPPTPERRRSLMSHLGGLIMPPKKPSAASLYAREKTGSWWPRLGNKKRAA